MFFTCSCGEARLDSELTRLHAAFEGRIILITQREGNAPTAAASSHSILWQRRMLAFTCCAMMFLYAAYLGAIGVLLPAVGKTFELGSAAQGRLFPANFVGFILIVLIAAPASDRWNRKTVLMLGQAMFVTGLIVFSRAPSFGVALAASLLIGGGSGAVGVISSALASDLYPLRRGAMLAAIQVAFGLGAALGPGLGSVLLSHQVSWRLLYAGAAFAGFALLLALQAQKEEGETRRSGEEGKGKREKGIGESPSTINYQLSPPSTMLSLRSNARYNCCA